MSDFDNLQIFSRLSVTAMYDNFVPARNNNLTQVNVVYTCVILYMGNVVEVQYT